MSNRPLKEKKSSPHVDKGLAITSLLLLLFWGVINLSSSIFPSGGFSGLLRYMLAGVFLTFLLLRLIPCHTIDQGKTSTPGSLKLSRLFFYFFYMIGQIFIAGVDVARRVFRPKLNISPGVIKFSTPLRDEWQITLNANSITLAPGNITLDVEQNENGSTFWVYCISKEELEKTKAGKGFVEKILNLWVKK